MAASNTSGEIKKMERSNSAGLREKYMLLSTTYPLNTSDTKRLQVGLRRSFDEGVFVPAVKLLGNTSSGIRMDSTTWEQFREKMEAVGSYLRCNTEETPQPILLDKIAISFTTAYGTRAIMVSQRTKTEESSNTPKPVCEEAPPSKKRKLYYPNVVMQKISFEGLENIVQCIDARYEQLQSLANLVNDCSRFLIAEIELNLPEKKMVNEDIVKQTLADKYQEIMETVRRQINNLQFLDCNFNITFNELTSLFLNEIIQTIILNVSA